MTNVRTVPVSWIEKLNRIGLALSSEHNLGNLLSLVVRSARELTTSDAGSLYIVSGSHLSFEVSQSNSLGESKFSPYTLPIDRNRIAGYVALTGRLVNIEDVYSLPPDCEFGFCPDFDKMMGYRTKSVLAVPMKDQAGEIIGVLELINALKKPNGKVPEDVIPFKKEYEGIISSLASQAAVAIRNARLIEKVKSLFSSFVQFYAAEVDARDPCCAGHSRRARELAIRIAQAINECNEPPFDKVHFSDEELEALGYAALLHDVGKIGVREVVLTKAKKLSDLEMEIIRMRFALAKKVLELESARKDGRREELERKLKELDDDLAFIEAKVVPAPITDEEIERLRRIASRTFSPDGVNQQPLLTEHELKCLCIRRGSLTDEELAEARKHAEHTMNFLSKIPFTGWLKDVPVFAACHHEMLDGSGYPRGLKGDEIPLGARILAVVDIFDAVTSDRPYRKAIPLDTALSILREEAEKGRLDKDIVNLFIEKKLYLPRPND